MMSIASDRDASRDQHKSGAGLTIARLVIGASLTTLACVAIAIVVIFMGINEIKVHGPVYERIKTANDLTADILPPPLYVLETYLTLHQLQDTKDPAESRGLETHLQQL